MQFHEVLIDMESRGIRINVERARRQQAIGEARMLQVVNELGGKKPSSPKDLQQLLIDQIGIPISRDHITKKGRKEGKLIPSFDKKAMEYYDAVLNAWADNGTLDESRRSIASLVREYRGWQKAVSAYYRPYQELLSSDGRLRPNYKIHGTKTRRLSCSDPNLQQIPKETEYPWNGQLKKVFIPMQGYVLLSVDYSQLELRLASAYAKQENWLSVFNAERDPSTGKYPDVFNAMSEEMGIPRQDCKTITYAKMFGAAAAKIALLLGGDPAAAMGFIKEWDESHDKIVSLAKKANDTARLRKYINLWTGAQRHFPTLYDEQGKPYNEYRKAFNSLIQGGGAEIVKSAMIRLHQVVDNPECRMLLQVHDAVVFEIKEDKLDYYRPIIEELMMDVKREKDFGVRFNVESELWGLTI